MTTSRFRFGLRGCLIFLAVLSFLLAWLVPQRSLRMREAMVMNQLKQEGSGYSYYGGFDEDDSTWTEKRFDGLFGKRIRNVKWNNRKIDDLAVLTKINNLRELFITNSQISDLTPIAQIKSIRLIELTGSNITDLTPFRSLPNLEYLNLHRTPVTDEQVAEFVNAKPDCRVLHPSIAENSAR